MLGDLRGAIAADLTAGGVKALGYLGEAVTPPCALVIPAEPYVRRPDGTRPIPFRKCLIGVDVLLVVARTEASKTAQAIDELIEQAYAALKPNHTIGTVSRPGVITISGSKFVGSVLSIEALTEEP